MYFYFKFFFFLIFFLYSVLIVKLNVINKKAWLINLVLQFYLYKILVSMYFLEILDFLTDTELISVIWTMRWALASCTQCCTLILI